MSPIGPVPPADGAESYPEALNALMRSAATALREQAREKERRQLRFSRNINLGVAWFNVVILAIQLPLMVGGQITMDGWDAFNVLAALVCFGWARYYRVKLAQAERRWAAEDR